MKSISEGDLSEYEEKMLTLTSFYFSAYSTMCADTLLLPIHFLSISSMV